MVSLPVPGKEVMYMTGSGGIESVLGCGFGIGIGSKDMVSSFVNEKIMESGGVYKFGVGFARR